MVNISRDFPSLKRSWKGTNKPSTRICSLRIKDYEVFLGEPTKREEPFSFKLFVLIHWYRKFLDILSPEKKVSYLYRPY